MKSISVKKSFSTLFAAASLLSISICAYAGTYTRNNPATDPAGSGIPHTETRAYPATTEYVYSNGPSTFTSDYTWQWAPAGGDWVADPAPSKKVEHTFVMGGGPVEANRTGSAVATASFLVNAYINSTWTLQRTTTASASVPSGRTTQSTPISTAAQTYNTGTTALSPDGFGVITAHCQVSATASLYLWTYGNPSSASSTTSGTATTTNAALLP